MTTPSSASVSDNVPLHDVQASPDGRGVGLMKAGVRGVEMPIRLLQKDGGVQTVTATASLGVDLPGRVKGTHMSRFIIQLAEWSRTRVLTLNVRDLLADTMSRLSSRAAYLDLSFLYFVDKKAPVTELSAPMGYRCAFHGLLETPEKGETRYQLILGVSVPVSTLCPCSKAISNYGAHNQRAEIRAQVILDTMVLDTRNESPSDRPMVWIEDLARDLEECASCPVYPVLKRRDEKYVTERQYDNPKFVEDVVRDATLLLREYPGVAGFSLEVEALESIHGHNAWACHAENFADGRGEPWSA